MDETPLSDSRCATHPSEPTVAICRRCGDHLCVECLAPDALGAVFCIAEPWRAAVLHTLLAKTLLSAIPLVNLADQLWIFAPGSRCLHDIASGTRVIAVRRAACPRPLG